MPPPNSSRDVHIYIHVDSVAMDGKIQQILLDLEKIMASLDETLAAVQQESTVDDSIIALLNGLAGQIAAGGLSAGFGLAERRQEHGCQDSDNRDNDQQLDQGETPSPAGVR